MIFPTKLMEVREYLLQVTAAAAVLICLLLARTLTETHQISSPGRAVGVNQHGPTPTDTLSWQEGNFGEVTPGM